MARYYSYALAAAWGGTLSISGYEIDSWGFWVGFAFFLAAYTSGRLVEACEHD